jgi:hypothetical protein
MAKKSKGDPGAARFQNRFAAKQAAKPAPKPATVEADDQAKPAEKVDPKTP